VSGCDLTAGGGFGSAERGCGSLRVDGGYRFVDIDIDIDSESVLMVSTTAPN